MWPWSKRKPKEPTPGELRRREIRELAPIGSTFNYLGVECVVRSNIHSDMDIHSGSVWSWPEVVLEYVDNLGIIRTVKLDYTQFMAAKARNEA